MKPTVASVTKIAATSKWSRLATWVKKMVTGIAPCEYCAVAVPLALAYVADGFFDPAQQDRHPGFLPARDNPWFVDNIPFECPDKDITDIYYYRWWSYRKNIQWNADLQGLDRP